MSDYIINFIIVAIVALGSYLIGYLVFPDEKLAGIVCSTLVLTIINSCYNIEG